MFITTLLNALPGVVAQGLIWSINGIAVQNSTANGTVTAWSGNGAGGGRACTPRCSAGFPPRWEAEPQCRGERGFRCLPECCRR